jgi:cell division protein FtsL
MATDVKDVVRFIVAAPRVLKFIGVVAAIDIVVLMYAAFALEDDVSARLDTITRLKSELASQQQKIQSTRKQIDELPQLRKLYDQALNSGMLASQDRLKFVNLAQESVTEHRLSDFHFKLDPETSSPLRGTKYQLVSTNVILTNGALRASDAFAFWDDILSKSQAHYQVTKLLIERTPLDLKTALAQIGAGQSPQMVKAELQFSWRSMRQTALPEKAVPSGAAKR